MLTLLQKYPCLTVFSEQELHRLEFVKYLRMQGSFREDPQYQSLRYLPDEQRGAWEGPLNDIDLTNEMDVPLNSHLW